MPKSMPRYHTIHTKREYIDIYQDIPKTDKGVQRRNSNNHKSHFISKLYTLTSNQIALMETKYKMHQRNRGPI